MDELRSKIGDETTKPRQKKEVIFRGQPEIVTASSSVVDTKDYAKSAATHGPIEWALDNNLSTFWHSRTANGNYIKIEFHRSEMLKKIDIYRRQDGCGVCAERYLLEVILYRDDKRIKSSKTTDKVGNPFIPGSYQELWNPIYGL